MRDLFPLSKNYHQMKTRTQEKYEVVKARTSMFYIQQYLTFKEYGTRQKKKKKKNGGSRTILN